MTARESYTYFDGKWHDGTPNIINAETHGFNLGSSVYDGARYFEGVTPDLELHSARINRSAKALGLEPTHTPEEIEKIIRDGLKRFKSREAIYIRPMYWSEAGGYMYIPPDPASTRFLVFLVEEPMIDPKGFSVTFGKWRRPSAECAPTDAKAGALYPMGGRIIMEAKSRGFENALVLDLMGNVAETASSNVFMVKDGVVKTPVPNGSFLNGITRQRVAGLLRKDGYAVEEVSLKPKDFLEADEIFATGNHSKVTPIIRIEERHLQAGPITKRARELYWSWAHGKG